MPSFQNQRRGASYLSAIPGKRFGAPKPNSANALTVSSKPFRTILGTLNMGLSGVSRDSAGATLGFCQVLVFRTADKTLVAETTSDALGAWSISLMKGGPFFLVEYKAGSPDVAGTSLNTLVPIQV